MKPMHAVFIAVLPALLLSCSTWSNEAVLVDRAGCIYYGTVRFDPQYQTGTITIPSTLFGDIAGSFTLVATGEKPIIELSRIPLLQFSGKAHLGSGTMRFLECDITAEFKSKGMGDMKMVGCGTCYDQHNDPYDLSFQ
jgi:hypothetical protein